MRCVRAESSEKISKNGCSPYSTKWLLKLKINLRESALFSIVFYLDKFNVIFVQGFVGYKKVGDCDREPKKFLGKIYQILVHIIIVSFTRVNRVRNEGLHI